MNYFPLGTVISYYSLKLFKIFDSNFISQGKINLSSIRHYLIKELDLKYLQLHLACKTFVLHDTH